MKKIVLLIHCALSTLFYAQVPENTPEVSFAIETYAFLRGQSAALQKVALQFPQLRPKVTAAEKNARTLFGRAERNIGRFLEEELEDAAYDALQAHVDSLLFEQLKDPIEKEQHALEFLAEVQRRPHSIADTLLLKGIISFAYHDAPHQEITDGHAAIFTTEGHPKAEGSILRFPLPQSWLAEEAQMPETVQQFTSLYGRGNAKFLILVYDLSAGHHDLVLAEDSISKMMSPQTSLIRTDRITIDGRPGMMVEAEETITAAASEMKVRMMQFMCIEERKLYCLQGSIGPVAPGRNLDHQIKKYGPLFRLIAARTKIGN